LIVSSLDALSFASPNASVEIKDKYIDHNNNVLTYELTVRLKKKENFILHIVNSENSFDNSMGLVSLTINDFRFLLWNFIKRYLPTYEMALYGSSLYKPAAGLDTYDLFLANSRFTIKWTEKYWGKSANLLYPPVDVQKFKPGKKENIILNVGRFFTGGHSKRQDILVEVFKGLIDSGRLDKSWELHLVGGVASGEEHRNFFLSMRNQADEYPIFFHTQMGFQELKKLYSRAKIYWHATGYGGDENKSPITFEHFGITVVEAMAAGCVPVVFRGGGLTETVDSSDLTWRSKERLETITLNLINNPKVMKKHSLYAVHRAQRYSRENFEKRFLGIVGNIIGNKNG
jgi:glycosyltransferase involved in cell wall biosynthesis